MAKAVQPQKIRFSQAIQTPLYKNLVNNTLGDPVRAGRFIANITSAVAVNAELQKCDPGTILACTSGRKPVLTALSAVGTVLLGAVQIQGQV